ncbi:dynein axonemal assembly factor 3 [Ischnura elegans]|uniref:dynein axonemal assembly factor 3 n=1 Tax=Ischnura elegans TaxID=197161 RepID=UPI001ED8BCE5|nr:dynein axonemal assembly factor 3 [Ischnura elegans]
MWGYSPALDLLEEITLLSPKSPGEDGRKQLNILLIGNCDGRHIFKTLAQLQRLGADDVAVTFYVIEKSLEPVARQMLLLTLALEPADILGLQEKTILFLEVYGNTIIRPTSYNYIIQKAHQLIHMVTDFDYLAARMPIINIENLKYKERDALETIFKFWISTKASQLNTEFLWDSRLRRSLTNRYDSKLGVFDWDYHMKLCKAGQESISHAEYNKWRLKGIAFSWHDRVLSKSNYTLISGIQKVNGEIVSFGYTGDIENGPFATYGLTKDIGDGKRKIQNPRKCTTACLKEVMTMLSCIIRSTESVVIPDGNELEGTVLADDLQQNLCSLTDKSEDFQAEESARKIFDKETYSAAPLGPVKVVYLPLLFQSDIHLRDKFRNVFDAIVISHNSIDSLNSNLIKTAKSNSIIVVETLNFVLPPQKGFHEAFVEKIEKLANDSNCKPIQLLDGEEDFYRRFEVVTE